MKDFIPTTTKSVRDSYVIRELKIDRKYLLGMNPDSRLSGLVFLGQFLLVAKIMRTFVTRQTWVQIP